MIPLPTTRIVSTTAALLEGLTPEEKDELTARLADRGYKPELATTKRAASTGETGSILTAANAYKLFNAVGPEVGGVGLLKTLRRPCCGLPDRSWQDPDTGRPVERAITFGHWRPDHTVTVAYRFTRTPDSGDTITADEIRACFEAALACWSSVAGIKLRLIDDLGSANIQIRDASIDRIHGVLADMWLPGPGAVGGNHICHGRFDWNEEWGVRGGGRPLSPRGIDFLNVLVHELGHAWGMDHEPGQNAECLNPMYWPAPHLIGDGRHWMGPKDTATMRRVYGPPVAKPEPPKPDPGAPLSGRLHLKGVYHGVPVPTSPAPGTAVRLDGVFDGVYEPLP